MLINDYLSSNIIICIYYFDLTCFRELGQIYNFFCSFLVQMKTLEFASEIYCPLGTKELCEKEINTYLKKMILDKITKFYYINAFTPMHWGGGGLVHE